MKTVTAAQMRELDQRTIEEFGIPGDVLMERAGQGVADAIRRLAELAGFPIPTVHLIAGRGNNGGDAYVAARVLKNALKEAMVQDYVVLARIKGLSDRRIVFQEALRNAVVPTLTLTGVQFAFLIGGTVIVERIFSYPGIGNMAIDAVINRDLPLIQGLVLTFAVLFIAINLAVDMSYALLNPRMRHG